MIVSPRHQGATNGCGTLCLAMAMDFWRPRRPENRIERIDQAIRPFDLFTAPGDLLRYARAHGYQAALLTDAQFADLGALLDRGIPSMVLGNRDGSLHYMLAVGYEGELEAGSGSLAFVDPACGEVIELDLAEVDAFWRDLDLHGWPTGISQLLLAIAPGGGGLDFPIRPLQPAAAMLVAALGVKDVAIAYAQHQPLRALAGATEVLAGLVGTLGSVIAGWGSRWRRLAVSRFDWILAFGVSLAGWTLQVAGMPLAWVGEAVGSSLLRLLGGREEA